MPKNVVWIDGLTLPVSSRHGWWFGCDLDPSGTAYYCRLVTASGEQVYAGEYLPCGVKSPVPLSTVELVPPPVNVGMWIEDRRLIALAPIGALRNGDFLLPVATLDRCDEWKNTHH